VDRGKWTQVDQWTGVACGLDRGLKRDLAHEKWTRGLLNCGPNCGRGSGSPVGHVFLGWVQ